MKFRTLFAAVLATSPLALAACSDSTGTSAPGQVQLRFGVSSGLQALKSPTGALAAAAGAPLAVPGRQRSLPITRHHGGPDKFQPPGLRTHACRGGPGPAGRAPGG